MDGPRWVLAICLAAIAFAAMATLTARSEPGTGLDEPEPAAASESVGASSDALSASSAGSGCTDVVSPSGEDDEGLDVEAIAENVERLRGLRFSGEPDVELVPVEELDRRVTEATREQVPPMVVADEGRVLELLGAIGADADLYELYTEGLEGQVAGIYLPESREMLVARGADPGVLERITVAHELEHALADDRLGLPFGEGLDVERQDAQAAAHALVEGDATMLMELYAVRHVGLGDLLDLGGAGSFAESEADLEELPYHLQRELLWPYSDGARFVCRLYRRGGWDAVNRAYAEPPAATDQILFPERYGDRPADPPATGRLPAPWRERRTAELGAAPLLWLFEAPGGDPGRALPDPRGAVAAWAGGESTLWADGKRSALGISLVERDPAVPRLCAAVAGWLAATRPDDERLGPRGNERLVVSGPGVASVLSCARGVVRVGIGPNVRTARRLTRG
jgi:hypothetical protein